MAKLIGEDRDRFQEKIGSKEARKIRARRDKSRGIWLGLGMMGMVGWSVAVPTLIGVAIGIWMDIRYPGRISWTLTFLSIGLVIGCANAWYWVERERGKIEASQGDE
ncbi:MAG: putative F0F1-ATPase [Methanosaeta sp. PtaB.Bin018]|jgi:ATP synthase protein I|nr:ATPase F0F1 [Methanothrix sp.]OPX75171.1 MAG: putative F0F1-ATPase [Methanosaeta sp. PtaB.Bin018]OPY47545.1 MAG: putative F0F1-ATPase [Methanosaeta sp. PtaU1.Bin016]